MSIDKDPVRWSDPNSDVPDVLRELMQAGASDLPSAAKIASLGTKVTATSAAGAGSTLGAAKLLFASLGVGAAVLGGSLLYTADEPPVAPSSHNTQEASADSAEAEDSGAARGTAEPGPQPLRPTVTPMPQAETGQATAPQTGVADSVEQVEVDAPHTPEPRSAEPSTAEPRAAEPSTYAVRAETTPGVAREPAEADSKPRKTGLRSAVAPTPTSRAAEPRRAPAPAAKVPEAPQRAANANANQEPAGEPTEVSLLLEARRALTKSPRRALELAHRHASLFPQSQFAQERDALEIEALTRGGQLERARDAARTFVRRFPNSAHAHRFRERLDL